MRGWTTTLLVPLLVMTGCVGPSGEQLVVTVSCTGVGDLTGDACKTFIDPQGTYTIIIADAWTEIPGAFVKENEAWAVAEPVDGFAANVNVLTQDALGSDLTGYLDLTVKNLGELKLVDRRTVTGTNGNELGLLEYNGALPGAPAGRTFHVLQTIDLHNGNAIVATLTTADDSFDTYRSSVEPFLLTLQAT